MSRRPEERTPASERLGDERGAPPKAAQAARPALWPVVVLGMLLVVGAAAWIAVGAQYAIAVVVLAALGGVFFGTHQMLGRSRTRRADGGRMRSADDTDSAVPHLGFDEGTPLGDTDQHSEHPHTPPRSTGAR
jgi:hypothetical protein